MKIVVSVALCLSLSIFVNSSSAKEVTTVLPEAAGTVVLDLPAGFVERAPNAGYVISWEKSRYGGKGRPDVLVVKKSSKNVAEMKPVWKKNAATTGDGAILHEVHEVDLADGSWVYIYWVEVFIAPDSPRPKVLYIEKAVPGPKGSILLSYSRVIVARTPALADNVVSKEVESAKKLFASFKVTD